MNTNTTPLQDCQKMDPDLQAVCEAWPNLTWWAKKKFVALVTFFAWRKRGGYKNPLVLLLGALVHLDMTYRRYRGQWNYGEHSQS